MTYCPECGAEIETEPKDLEEGDLVECDECGAELEVTSTSPVMLEPIEDAWDDDEEEDEDWD